MVISCSAPGCSSKKESVNSRSSVQFHRFPLRKPDILAKWVKAMKCPNFKATVTSYLCSAHFAASDYDSKTPNGAKHLKPNAVPTYFEKRRPGRKKKIVSESEVLVKEEIPDEYLETKIEEEYLEVEGADKTESNLAEIIGDQDKGTLHVLIVGEDGKITNSEYIFKKETVSDEEEEEEDYKPDSEDFGGENKMEDEDSKGCKGSPTEVSSELVVFRDLNEREKIKRLETALASTRKKIKVLQIKYRGAKKRVHELKLLLKLLVLKRGKGEKSLKELLEEYDKFEVDDIVREQELDF